MLSLIAQKAQSFLDQTNLATNLERQPSKAALFREQFRLPESQHPLAEISAELYVPLPYSTTSGPPTSGEKARDNGTKYQGELHLSESFICFSTLRTSFLPTASHVSSTSFTGPTNGAGPGGHGLTLPLCSIRRVERLSSQQHVFSLALTVWDKHVPQMSPSMLEKGKAPLSTPSPRKVILHLDGSRQACERFCDQLKKSLRESMKELDSLRGVVSECYSEYLMDPTRSKAKEQGTEAPPQPNAGLGSIFRYPGDARKLRDKSKMRLWTEYMRENGRNATLVRQPTFHKLIRVGLPNRLRGEMWEVCSGSFYTRLRNPKLYQQTLDKFIGKESLAIDEIEKDLNRSLPEYAGYQTETGINRLRRVLTAYSWTNEEVGYCQAMNIVVAAILIYTSEIQAFFLLSALCDRFVPGYYSKDMYGTLLDQKVFENLVEQRMPVLWEHLVKSDVNLSVVSLPWFLSLYINSMPLVFAFRVLDVFFLEGPKVLFQIGLAILRINGEELLDVADDGSFISILKHYFSRLDESAHPHSQNEKLRAITKFQELMVTAFKEFGGITHSTVTDLREKHIDHVKEGLATFAKRTSIRNLGPESKKLSTEDLSALYDRFFGILQERQIREKTRQEERRKQEMQRVRPGLRSQLSNNNSDAPRAGDLPLQTMDYDAFRELLAQTAKWAVTDSPSSPLKESSTPFGGTRTRTRSALSLWGSGPEPADHDFMQRLYGKWDESKQGSLTLQNIVNGLARLKGTTDIMNSMSLFFDLFDDDATGKVDREGILRMSESLLFLSRRGFDGALVQTELPTGMSSPPMAGDPNNSMNGIQMSTNEKFLGSVSAFIRRCFEYADPDEIDEDVPVGDVQAQVQGLNITKSGDDNDLLGLGETKSHAKSAFSSRPVDVDPLSQPSDLAVPKSDASNVSGHPTSRAASHNLALDPNTPLHITLPTFRMVILADELLEQFFETFFPQSFHLSTTSTGITSSSSGGSGGDTVSSPSSNATLSGNLTTFANLGTPMKNLMSSTSGSVSSRKESVVDVGIAGGIVEPGSRGLRGVLDNIVTDGMRMAAEMRKRMDEAQREFEKEKQTREGKRPIHVVGHADDEDDEEEEDEDYDGAGAGTARRRDRDQDLLEGAEAVSIKTTASSTRSNTGLSVDDLGGIGGDQNRSRANSTANSVSLLDLDGGQGGTSTTSTSNTTKTGKVEFER